MRWHWSRRGTNASVPANKNSSNRTPDSGCSTPVRKPAVTCSTEVITTTSALEQRPAIAHANTSSTTQCSGSTQGSAIQLYSHFIARFKSVEVLQDGATGIAYHGIDTISNRVVVLKTYNSHRRREISALNSAGQLDKDTMKETCRLDVELRFLTLCAGRSRNVVALLGAFQHPDLPARTTMVLEYAQLGDLFEFSKAALRATRFGRDTNGKAGIIRGLPETLLWHWTAQMSSALAFLHSDLGGGRAIIHSDVKLENWLICASSQSSLLYGDCGKIISAPKPADSLPTWAYPDVKLADFDLARFADDAPRGYLHSTWGTPAAQPPEFPRDSRAADVWGTGACLHHLVTGRYPIESTPPGWRGTEEERSRYEVRVGRRVEDVRFYSASRHMDEMLRGRVHARGGPKIGGLLNLDFQLRWTAGEAKMFSEDVIGSNFLGKAKQFPLGKWAYSASGRSESEEAYPDINSIEDGLAAVKL